MRQEFYRKAAINCPSTKIVKQGYTEIMAYTAAIGGAVALAGNDSLDEDEVVDNIKYTICGVLASPLFNEKIFQQRPLKVYVEHTATCPNVL